MAGNDFLKETQERSDLNQYWYSQPTIDAFVEEISACGGTAALVSTPSVYFSLPQEVKARCKVLDFDRQWEWDAGFVFYDFNKPIDVPADLHCSFDYVLIDPPFITREVWTLYAETAKLLMKDGGRLLCTTIFENAAMMKELLAVTPTLFRPSIPNLVYQYSIYTNYRSERLEKLNPEIDECDWRNLEAKKDTFANGLDGVVVGNLDKQALDPEALVQAALEAQLASGAQCVESTDEVSPEVALLTELRDRLGSTKRNCESLRVPLQQAVRRPSSTSATTCSKSLESTHTQAAASKDWLVQHKEDLIRLLSDSEVAEIVRWFEDTLGHLSGTKLDQLTSMDAYQEWASVSKESSSRAFQLSNSILQRVKALKKAPQQQ
mmetsp:Transcript_80348/g.176135  ORF Transcript_80348/g.176135 Transcript_80348/m.176135 type:complete len:378 (-) Transcript_80348:213-1346(-)|eukprot:CAMPEP_0206540836 /NCGR_PEP_ID=MMETSP0325_2-20121206/9249_1 /ASSEMBLY_ACC=CAM_ASM_000347 /TAXON_ID=2866 /ORGANISM="Crypthecodinium cohnii, Strain Seligo" /LENGTH=377 /DNA_ID=CAMNT_0054038649 /DNA_START=22 /DNA_END=1155 /DNA_ORIENTATION=-